MKKDNIQENGQKKILTTSDMIVQELRTKIINGVIKSGTQLKNTQLAEEFGTSITPVREALNRLEKMDLVEYKPRCGWYAKGIDENGMREVYDMRKILELFSVEVICDSESEKDLSELVNCCDEYKKKFDQGDMEACINLDIQFHCKLVALSGNRFAIEVMDRLRNLMNIYRTIENYESNNIRSYEDHVQIVSFLQKRDKQGVKRIIQGHIRPCSFE